MEFLSRIVLVFFILSLNSVNAFQNKTIEEIVSKQSPLCVKKKKNIFLTKDQMKRIEQLAKSKMPSPIVLAYELSCKEGKKFIYFHSDIVRTLNQTLAIHIFQKKIEKIEMVAFLEPFEYLAPKKWMHQYKGKVLKEELDIHRDIDGISGATLTARATNDAARRVLSMHKVLFND